MNENTYLPPVAEVEAADRRDAWIVRVRHMIIAVVVLAVIVGAVWGTASIAGTIRPTVDNAAIVKRARLCPDAEAVARVVEIAPGLVRVECWDGAK